MIRTAFIDDQLLSSNFKVNDLVRKPGLRGHYISPYTGVVQVVNRALGIVLVQWPWGIEQERPHELIIDASKDFVPVSSFEPTTCGNLSYVATPVSHRDGQVLLFASKVMHRNFDELETFVETCNTFHATHSNDSVRSVVSSLFADASRLAIYWKDNRRRYRVTQRERETGVLFCPRCRSHLKPRTYTKGRKNFLCKECGFSIHPKDLK